MAEPIRCPACGHFAPMIWVHGHGQCAVCRTNIAPCCDGAPTDDGRQGVESAPDRKTGLPAVVGAAPRLLILGSMPGEESLRRQQYYAHPQNQFWLIAGELFGALPALAYEERLAELRRAGVALWDVARSCRRVGSADATMVDVEANAIVELLAAQPSIRKVLCNGQKAHALFVRLVAGRLPASRDDLVVERVPSTSPAHASLPFEHNHAAWRRALVLDSRPS